MPEGLPGTESPSLVELMRMTREEWDRWTRGSAIRQAGYAGFKPYMHDGSMATLEDVVEHYDRGGAIPWLDPEIRPLNLSDTEKRDLVAFLHALTSDVAEGWQTTPSR